MDVRHVRAGDASERAAPSRFKASSLLARLIVFGLLDDEELARARRRRRPRAHRVPDEPELAEAVAASEGREGDDALGS